MVKYSSVSQSHLTPSVNLIDKSIKLLFKNYDRVAFFFLIPYLIDLLSSQLLGEHKLELLLTRGVGVLFTNLTTKQLIGDWLFLAFFIIFIVNYPFSLFFRLISVRQGTSPSVIDCYKQALKAWPKVLIVQILAWISIVVGLIVFIVPGILIFRRLWLSPYYALDNPDLSIYQIFKKSSQETAPFQFYVYSTALIGLVVTLALELVAGGSVIIEVIATIISYGILFLPALRYQEIISAQIKQTQTKPDK